MKWNLDKKALTATIGFHVVLLLLFLFIKYAPPVQAAPSEEMGIEVNLGTDLDGSGDDQPMDIREPAPIASQASQIQAAANESSREKEWMTSEKEERNIRKSPTTPAKTQTNSTPRSTKSNTTTTATTAPSASRPQPKYAFKGASGEGGNRASTNKPGTGEGIGQGKGDMGVPGGTPGAPNYTGTPGNGTLGINHSIADRRIVAFPEREAEFNNGGKVVLRITVNRDGKIIAKQVKSSPSGTLTQIAMRKAEQIRFDKNEQAPVEQFGTVTFVFKTRG